jgi:hypothetical protein
MNVQPVTNQPISDDGDLAKVLSGAEGELPQAPEAEVAPAPEEAAIEPAPAEIETPVVGGDNPLTGTPIPSGHEELEEIKKEALEELKPLIDKLQVTPEEKFDIILLIIRSTDDEELVGKAHETAQQIEDETRRAQALLDIIKEVDYFANK